MKDLKKEYPEADIDEEESAAEILLELYAENDTAQFVFVLDILFLNLSSAFFQSVQCTEHKKYTVRPAH